MHQFEQLAEPLGILPPVEFAFSYGSGVFPQTSNQSQLTTEKPMVDYILGVSSPSDWHSKYLRNCLAGADLRPTGFSLQNIERNPHHYSSWLAKFGGSWVSGCADTIGVGIHFNPFIPWKNKTIKYGVISMERVKEDILTWKSLYTSGRLQKPIFLLVDTEELICLNLENLKAALYSAMLLAPPQFSEEELYMNICGLSYLGDIRMFFAEDKRKVQKIVRGSSQRFGELYRGPLHSAANSGLVELPRSFGNDPQAKLVQGRDKSQVIKLVAGLPMAVLARLASQIGVTYESHIPRLVVAEAVAQSREGHEKLVRKAIGGIVRKSSLRQAVSGLFAAGGVNALQYLVQKTSKAWRSWEP